MKKWIMASMLGLAVIAAQAQTDTYLVVDLSGGTNAVSYPVSYLSDVPAGGWTDAYKTDKLVLRKIPAGTFTMGSPTDELGRGSDETQHEVTLTKDFYIGVFKVTQRQWELVMGNRPSYFTNATYYATRPVEQVSYYDIRENPANSDDPAVDWPVNANVNADSFMGKLRTKTGLAVFDLPTEAQWEYACRAGTVTALNSGSNLTSTTSCPNMGEVGRYAYNGGSDHNPAGTPITGTAVVGSYLPNAWGLYDMHGNTFHWCLDWYDTYPAAVIDPKGALSGAGRVIRGGGFADLAYYCRSASRVHKGSYGPETINFNIGFRVVGNLSEIDTDADGMDDAWEMEQFGNLDQPADGDFDADGRTNAEEEEDGTDPIEAGSTLGLVLYYPFNGDSLDESGYGNHGTAVNEVQVSDRFNNQNSAYGFEGDGYVEVQQLPAINPNGDFTYSTWMLVESPNQSPQGGAWYIDRKPQGNGDPIVSMYSQSSISGFNLLWYVRYDNYTLPENGDRLSAGIFHANAWKHYLIVRKYGEYVRTYTDGEMVSSVADNPLSLTPDRPIIGNYASQINYGLVGAVDDFRIYNRALLSNEVARLYDAAAPRQSTYQLIEGSFTWHEAKADAEARGGHLACFPTETDWLYMRTQIGTAIELGNWWLGGTDEDSEGNWEWITGELWDFTMWYPGEPNNMGGEDYLHVWNKATSDYDYTWNDAPASGGAIIGYILEIEGSVQPSVLKTDLSSLEMSILDSQRNETGNPVVGEAIEFEVTVHNTGETNTADKVLVQIFEGAVPPDLSNYNSNEYAVVTSAVVAESIGVGSSATVSIQWTVTGSDRMASFTAIAEFESNRAASEAGSVLPVDEMSLSNNSVGQSVTIGSLSGNYGIEVQPAVPAGLQSGVRYTLSGTANYDWGSNEPVQGALATVTINGEEYIDRTASPDGAWSVLLNGLPASNHVAQIRVDDGQLVGLTNVVLAVESGPQTIDLRVKQIAFESGTYRAVGETGYAVTGDPVVLKALLRNDGNMPSGNFTVSFNDPSGSAIATATTDLPAFSQVWVTAPSGWTAIAGSSTLTVNADSSNTVTEGNDDNNARTCTVVAAAANPDLIVTDISWSPGSLKDGDAATLIATIKNQGGATLTAGTSFHAVFLLDGVTLASELVPMPSDLPNGASTTVTTPWAAVAGSHSVVVTADSGTDIPEDFENNNSRTETFKVRQDLPDLRPYYRTWQNVSGLSFNPSKPVEGEPVTVNCAVYNNGTVPLLTETEFDVVFSAAGVVFATETVELLSELAVGAKVTVSTIWNGSTNGVVPFSVVVDTLNDVTEEYENNNSTARNLKIYQVETVLEAIGLSFSPNQPLPEGAVVLTATIRNSGGTVGGAGELVEFFAGSTNAVDKLGDITLLSDIDAKDGTGTAAFAWIAPSAATNIAIYVLVDGSVYSKSLTVTDNPAPNLQVFSEDISVSPVLPNSGESVTVMANIRNTDGSTANNFNVRFSYDRTAGGIMVPLETVPVAELAVGSNMTVTATSTIAAENSAYALKVEILPNTEQGDADDGDNIATSSFLLADTPRADAGADRNCFVGQPIVCDGTSSANASNYVWEIITAPINSTAELTNADSALPSFTPDAAGSYELRLIVNNGVMNSDPDTVELTVEWIEWVVESAHGSPVPSTGMTYVTYGSLLTNSVDSAVTNGTALYICLGWDNGTTNWFVTNVTTHGSVVWNWQTNWWMEAVTSGQGQVTGGDAWIPAGTNAMLMATPAEGWRFDGWLLDGAEQTEVCTTNGTNCFTFLMDSAHTVTATFIELTLAECVDNSDLLWTTGGNTNWSGQVDETHDSQDALRSGAAADTQRNWVETTVHGPGLLTYWWKVSSEENYDWLLLRVDDSIWRVVTGDTDWEVATFRIEGPGAHILRWEYAKDKSLSSGEDCGWLDQVIWTPDYIGFALWANGLGLTGDAATLFGQDRNGDGMANAFEYAFGTNLNNGLLLNIRMDNQRPVVEIPRQDVETLPYVDLRLLGSTNLIDWTLPVTPAAGAPDNCEWFHSEGAPDKAFFKLEAELK